jgi:hypothetical protein
VAIALGREPVPRGGARSASLPSPARAHTVSAAGALGQWDRYRLLNIFKRADRDGSGELSIDEIKACISECADYGFCVTLDDGTGGEEEEAGAGAGAGGAAGERPSSRAPTPLGLAASTALLGTASAAGRAAVAGAQRRLQVLLEAIFEAVDTNKSGTISWSEFSQALEDGSRGGGPAAPAERAAAGAAAAAPPTHVPRMRFRPLTSEECSARANRHFRVAREKYASLQAALQKLPPAPSPGSTADPAAAAAAAAVHSAWVKETSARLSTEAAAASEKGVRLSALARALGGTYDPPEAPPTPPPPRADSFALFRVVPASEAAAAGARGQRGAYRVPLPGEELGADDAATLAVLHPTTLQEEEEAEDELAGGTKRALRAASAAAVAETLGVGAWERHRLAIKARAPHAVYRATVHLTSPLASNGPL